MPLLFLLIKFVILWIIFQESFSFYLLVTNWRLSLEFWSPSIFSTSHGDQNDRSLERCKHGSSTLPPGGQTTCNWIKKILNEAIWMVNVFLTSWLFYLFLLCSISLLVKYDFILQYEAWVNAIRVSSFIENVPQISAKPIAFQQIFAWEAPTKLAVLYQLLFFSETDLENSLKIGHFFPQICPWKSREIWLFFCNLQEALYIPVV